MPANSPSSSIENRRCGDRVADDRRERRHGKRRKRRIDALDGLPHSRRERRRIAVGPRDDPHAAERILVERHVHRRRRDSCSRLAVADAANDADDLVEAVGAVADVDALADRIAVWKMTIDELLIDDGHHRGLVAVAIGEGAAPQQRDAQRLEVVRADDADSWRTGLRSALARAAPGW